MDVSAIKDKKGLGEAIGAVARASGHDADRRLLSVRSRELGVPGLVPENWRANGSLKVEARETYTDLRAGLQAALYEKYSEADSYYCWVWVQDFTDTDVIYALGDEMLSASYTVQADGPITIGEPVKVRPVTEYVQTNSGLSLDKRRAKAATVEKAVEHRSFAASGVEIRTMDTGTLQLSGYASVYDVDYDMGWYQERVAAGAGRRTLGESPDVQLLLNHESLPLARTTSGTLRLSEDARGLYVEADLDPEDPDVQSLTRKNRRGDLDQMSFAFRTLDDSWNEDYTHRTINQYSLHRGDVSVVNMGANPATAVAVRSAASTKALDGVISVLESRAGRTLSASTMETLTQVLKLVANADEAVDQAQPMLAELMGVANPDADDEMGEGMSGADGERGAESGLEARSEPAAPVPLPDFTSRARQRLAALERRVA